MFDMILYQTASNANDIANAPNMQAFGSLATLLAPFAGMIIAIMIGFFLLMLILYIYVSLAFMAIAKKAGNPNPGIAFIPFFIGPALICIRSSGRQWWPVMLLLGTMIPFFGLNILFSLAFAIFFMLWNWKTFDNIGKPGWWSIFFVLFPPAWLVLIGIAGWSKK